LHFLITASVPSPAELRHFLLIVGFCSLSDHTSKVSAVTASAAISYCHTHANEALQAIASVLLKVNNVTNKKQHLAAMNVPSLLVCCHQCSDSSAFLNHVI